MATNSLGGFARRMKKARENFSQNSAQMLIDAAVVANQVIVLSTPVDTGRARGNWQASLGVGIGEALEDNLDPSGGGTIAKNTATINSRPRHVDVYLSNNLKYIGALNAGHSAQAPAMFVEKGIALAVASTRNRKLFT